ncbi:MAG: Coenzyme F420 hydrogenase/dehydrogenase, beta subunit C-terminal domain [Clostridia bacterium]|nr:Coenzyme F420 hydrogenase/dehydrogenase, beta subunit C-terminal domain [Clostridia bacterium]
MEFVYKDKKNCCGCSACEYICPKNAIKMLPDNGFLYPVIDQDLCVDCGLCQKNCAFHKDTSKNPSNEAYAAKHIDMDIIKESSSGGVFTAISDYILNSGGTVYGADYNNDMVVFHIGTKDKQIRDRMRGAKYVQSNTSGVFDAMKTDISNGNPVLFTGTPCQVAAVKKLFGNRENLYTADIICHGVPSPEVWKKYVDFIERKYDKKLVYYKFRDKTKGWRSYAAKLFFEDGTIISHNNLTGSFIELFRYDVCLRDSCTNCPFTSLNRPGDITIGDFWGVENVMPQISDNMGTSAVIVNSEKGKKIIESISASLQLYPCSKEDIAKKQPPLKFPSSFSNKYNSFQHDFKTLPFDKVLKKYTRVGLKRKIIDFAKQIIKK